MLNGIEFQTVGAAYLKALRPTAVLVNGTCRKLCDADRRVLFNHLIIFSFYSFTVLISSYMTAIDCDSQAESVSHWRRQLQQLQN